eukprot:7667114-Lingulodinium_polyedra.AAC.1
MALYIAADRIDVQREVQLLARRLQQPTEWDQRRLVRLVRYLKGTRAWGVRLCAPTAATSGKVVIDMYSDTDFAGCRETRRAM